MRVLLRGDRAAGLQLELSSSTGPASVSARALFPHGAWHVCGHFFPDLSSPGPFQTRDGTGQTCDVVCASLRLDRHVPGSTALMPGQSEPRDRRWLPAWRLLSLLLLRPSMPTSLSTASLRSAVKPSVFFLFFPQCSGFRSIHADKLSIAWQYSERSLLFLPQGSRVLGWMHETSLASLGSTLKMRSTGCSSWLSRTRQGCLWTPPPSSWVRARPERAWGLPASGRRSAAGAKFQLVSEPFSGHHGLRPHGIPLQTPEAQANRIASKS